MTNDKQYHPSLPDLGQMARLFCYWPDYSGMYPTEVSIDRACVDRFLLIRERILDNGMMNSTILDLGGGAGYFSWALYLTVAKSVDMVEDQRARNFGYNENSFAAGIINKKLGLNATGLLIHDTSIESFLRESVRCQKRWDIMLCLSVLHHFVTGYGNNPEIGKLNYLQLIDLFKSLGDVTERYAYIEIDPERVVNYEKFMTDLLEWGGFKSMDIIGRSHSSIGVERNILEFSK